MMPGKDDELYKLYLEVVVDSIRRASFKEDFPVWDAKYETTMPDGSKWETPVAIIAVHRADSYKDEFGGDVIKSLSEDTLPLFTEDRDEIGDWASNNMNWADVRRVSVERLGRAPVDYQEGWTNGEHKVL